MLEPIVGSRSGEQVLVFLAARQEGYATEIADFYGSQLYAIQQQLEKFEDANVLVSKKVGRTRVYRFNPRYPFLEELEAILNRALEFYPDSMRERLLLNRRRPRRAGKPL
jgi:hypothetical protein